MWLKRILLLSFLVSGCAMYETSPTKTPVSSTVQQREPAASVSIDKLTFIPLNDEVEKELKINECAQRAVTKAAEIYDISKHGHAGKKFTIERITFYAAKPPKAWNSPDGTIIVKINDAFAHVDYKVIYGTCSMLDGRIGQGD